MSGAQAISRPDARPQLDQLTGLRGLAAWFVVFYHIRHSLASILPPDAILTFSKGYLAVDLFFMLSGFVMWLSYGQRFRDEGVSQTGPFLWKRFARVWPLHALVLAGFAAFVAALAMTGRPTGDYPLHELPLHVLMMQNWGFTEELTWNHPAWSISTEFAAYLMFPAVVLAVRWERLEPAVLLTILACLALALHGWFALWGYAYLGQGISQTGLMRCLIEFTMGIALANLWQRWANFGAGRIISAGIALVCALAGVGFGLNETVWFPACTAAVLLALALDRGLASRLLSARPMVALGDWSYATYLVHFFLFILFKIAFVGEDLQLGWTGLTVFVLLLLAVSAMLFHGFEKPAQDWVNARRPRQHHPSRR